jgi:uncharacterized membrane protein
MKMATAPTALEAQTHEEDIELRRWTPRVMRTTLFVAAALLIAGLAESTIASQAHYVARFRELQSGIGLRRPESIPQLLADAARGSGRALMTLGLMALTLIPIGRVALTFLIFLRQRDRLFVMMTGYVLAALILGAMLGRIG